MRRINKSGTIESFVRRVKNKKSKPVNWKDFHSKHQNVFNETRSYICEIEQNKLCGYTEMLIDNITNSHIDHYKKKDIFHELEFEWSNFIVALNDDNFGARYKDRSEERRVGKEC